LELSLGLHLKLVMKNHSEFFLEHLQQRRENARAELGTFFRLASEAGNEESF
jgi:hypothetical protein